MTLEEAIEILGNVEDTFPRFTPQQKRQAAQLGIEALKRCKEARKRVYFTTRSLLPGETV